jgi:hypothetical protein
MAALQICVPFLPFFSFRQAFVSASPSFLIVFCSVALSSLVPHFRCSLLARVSCSSLAFVCVRVLVCFLCKAERTTGWLSVRMKRANGPCRAPVSVLWCVETSSRATPRHLSETRLENFSLELCMSSGSCRSQCKGGIHICHYRFHIPNKNDALDDCRFYMSY